MPMTHDGSLQIQTFQEIAAETADKFRGTFGGTIATNAESVAGQTILVVAEERAVDQQVLLEVERSFDPESAQGASLDALSSTTGTIRRGSTQSIVQGTLTFNDAGTVANGDTFSNDDQQTVWEAFGGPYVAVGAGDITATLRSVDVGQFTATAGTNWSLITANTDLDSFTNLAEDATLGRLVESDPDFRTRRTVELRSQGIGGLASIASVLSRVSTENGTVDAVRVGHNPTINPTDSDGIPFKAFNPVLETTPSPPTIDFIQDISDAIGSVLGAGGQSFGTSHQGQYVDREGNSHTIGFDIVEEVDVFVAISVTTARDIPNGDLPVIPIAISDMSRAIRSAATAAALGPLRDTGRDVRAVDYIGVVMSLVASGDIDGIYDVEIGFSTVDLDDAQANIGGFEFQPITLRQRADTDSGEFRMIINGTTVTPENEEFGILGGGPL